MAPVPRRISDRGTNPYGVTLQDVASLARTTAVAARQERITVAAAGMTYHAFSAFVPLVLFVLVTASTFGELATVARVVELLAGPNAGAVESLLTSLTRRTSGRTLAVVIALAILLWSALRLFTVANDTFTKVYGPRSRRSLTSRLADVLLTFGTVVCSVVVALVVGVTLTFALQGVAVAMLTPLALVGILTLLFLPMYYIFPEPEMTVRLALPGALFAATVWTLSGLGLRAYATTSTSVQLYGVVGGLLLLLTWLYLGGFVLMVGVVINAVRGGHVDPSDRWAPGADARESGRPDA